MIDYFNIQLIDNYCYYLINEIIIIIIATVMNN